MAKKYRFRKVYFVCQDKKVFSSSTKVAPSFLFKEDAEHVRKIDENELFPYKSSNPHWKSPVFTIEAFYLVHESLYKELLEEHQKITMRLVKP